MEASSPLNFVDSSLMEEDEINFEIARGIHKREWKFLVLVPDLDKSEIVCITGDCEELGNWVYNKVVSLNKESDSPYWSVTLKIPSDREILFRYCICVVFTDPSQIIVRQWETHISPRKIRKESLTFPEEPDVFGEYCGCHKVDKGWLTKGTVLQFKFYSNPFTFRSKVRDGSLSIKLTPVNSQFNCDNQQVTLTEESLNTDTNDVEPPSCIIAEVATLNSSESKFKPQDQFGHIFNSEDFLIFNITLPNNQAIIYLVDFYKYSSKLFHHDPPIHIGYSYILPNVLKKSEGQLELPITCSSKHRPVGMMNVEFLVVHPLSEPLCAMKLSNKNHWSESWTGLDVGHRGLGSSFKTKESTAIRENTIASLKTAAANGADLLEFDVQLSKDLVPIIYHDFYVCIALKKKKQFDYNEMLEIPVRDLTLDQLQKLKVYHVVEGRTKEPRFFDEDLAEHQPFPLLAEVLEEIEPNVGFNIEIKWSMKLEDGTTDLQNSTDLNLYIDKILEVVLRSSVSRRIVFSCFHPDVCTMIRLKQNVYPTMFLTQGVTEKYPRLHDIRCNSIQAAVNHALNASLLGIVVHTEDLLRDSSQVKLVIDAGLIIFSWGDDNNNKETIQHLKKLGLHGVIFDKLDQYSTKEIKESVFLMEARETQKALLNSTGEGSQGDISSHGDIFYSPMTFDESSHPRRSNNFSNICD